MSYKIRSLLFFYGFLISAVIYDSLNQYDFWNEAQLDSTEFVQMKSEEIVELNFESDNTIVINE